MNTLLHRQPDEHARPAYWHRFESLVSDLDLDVSMLRLGDSKRVHLYEAGRTNRSDLIVVSPAESPFLLMSRVFQQLATGFHVVAWDNPAAAFMDCPTSLDPPTLDAMADDLLGLIEARQLRSPHVVSWCSGALIVLWAVARNPSAFASITFIAPPSVLSTCPERTGFQSHFLHLILELARGHCRDEAGLIRRIRSMIPSAEGLTGDALLISRLTGQPTIDDTAMRRYAKSMLNACMALPPGKEQSRDRAYVELVGETCRTVPISLLHCRDDTAVSYKCSCDVLARNENVRLVVYPKGGHFFIFQEAAMIAADIATFARTAR